MTREKICVSGILDDPLWGASYEGFRLGFFGRVPAKQPCGLNRARASGASPALGPGPLRVGTAQKCLRFALIPPIHAEGGFIRCAACARRVSQFFAGSDQGRMASSLDVMNKGPETQRPIPSRQGLPVFPREPSGSMAHRCAFSVLCGDDHGLPSWALRAHLRPGKLIHVISRDGQAMTPGSSNGWKLLWRLFPRKPCNQTIFECCEAR